MTVLQRFSNLVSSISTRGQAWQVSDSGQNLTDSAQRPSETWILTEKPFIGFQKDTGFKKKVKYSQLNKFICITVQSSQRANLKIKMLIYANVY